MGAHRTQMQNQTCEAPSSEIVRAKTFWEIKKTLKILSKEQGLPKKNGVGLTEVKEVYFTHI